MLHYVPKQDQNRVKTVFLVFDKYITFENVKYFSGYLREKIQMFLQLYKGFWKHLYKKYELLPSKIQ